ncbi:MAG: sugar transferase, partial [Candidatus Bathyarchaeota archaeon]|nr:sugar transferase [Candidatus Bathyarchaeota archaeon]
GRIPPIHFNSYLTIALWVSIIRISTFYFTGLYEDRETTPFDIFYLVSKAVTIGSVIIVALSFYLRPFEFSRTVFIISWMFNVLLISSWHNYLHHIRRKKMPAKKFLVIGSKVGQHLTIEAGKNSTRQFEILDLESSVDGQKKDSEFEARETIEKLKAALNKDKPDRVIIANPDFPSESILDVVFCCEEEEVDVWMVPGLYEVVIGKREIDHLGDIPLVKITNSHLKGRDKTIKMAEDFFFSSLVVLLCSPLMLLISLAIRLESRGPVLYRQKRVGRKGRVYEVYKFRSMVEDAEAKTGPVLANEGDERVTKVGSWLRKTHLDELPQFFNILGGEMSLIGPRPERPKFVEEFKRTIAGYSRRFSVDPGITGLAQLYGRYDTSAEAKLKYDLAYISNWSLGLDLKIFFMSIEVILTRRM